MSDPLDWMAAGACVVPAHASTDDAREAVGRFFTVGAPSDYQKAICASCQVRDLCLEYALANRIDEGYWGGMAGYQRERLRKQRGLIGRDPDRVFLRGDAA